MTPPAHGPSILWLIPAVLAAHTAEKVIGSAWATGTPLTHNPVITPHVMLMALMTVATAALLTGMIAPSPKKSGGIYVLMGVQALLVFGALAILVAAARERMYQPGAISAAVLVLPGAALVTRRVLKEGLVRVLALLAVVVVAALVQAMTGSIQLPTQ